MFLQTVGNRPILRHSLRARLLNSAPEKCCEPRFVAVFSNRHFGSPLFRFTTEPLKSNVKRKGANRLSANLNSRELPVAREQETNAVREGKQCGASFGRTLLASKRSSRRFELTPPTYSIAFSGTRWPWQETYSEDRSAVHQIQGLRSCEAPRYRAAGRRAPANAKPWSCRPERHSREP